MTKRGLTSATAVSDAKQPIDPTIEQARTSFRAFYSIATPDDALWMDALVLSWKAFVENTTIPAGSTGAPLRDHVERTVNEVEQNFMKSRDQVGGVRL